MLILYRFQHVLIMKRENFENPLKSEGQWFSISRRNPLQSLFKSYPCDQNFTHPGDFMF